MTKKRIIYIVFQVWSFHAKNQIFTFSRYIFIFSNVQFLFCLNYNLNFCHFSTLPWSSKSGSGEPGPSNPVPSFSLHKTRSSPSIFAMTAKSSGFPVDYNNTELVAQLQQSNGNTETSRNSSGGSSSSYKPEESPSVLRRSLTMQYDCDWKKSSTMPHDYNRSGFFCEIIIS